MTSEFDVGSLTATAVSGGDAEFLAVAAVEGAQDGTGSGDDGVDQFRCQGATIDVLRQASDAADQGGTLGLTEGVHCRPGWRRQTMEGVRRT